MNAKIELENISVWGVDTHARASSLRQWIIRGKSIRSTRIPILKNLSFRAEPGDRIAIIGINGGGKSSLLKVISGNYPIHEGHRIVNGKVVPLIEMGAGFEDELSGRQNIRLNYAFRGRLRDYSRAKEEQVIEFSELGDRIDLPLKTYSTGMRARLAFSAAIFQSPDILLLDEIFAAGDAGFVDKSYNKLKEKMDNAAITIMVHHGHNDILNLCNRFVLMDGGRIVKEGGHREIREHYEQEILHLSANHLKEYDDVTRAANL